MVRLKASLIFPSIQMTACFNSKMVRLKVKILVADLLTAYEFQFQNGSIKSRSNEKLEAGVDLFQFQNGSIKSYARLPCGGWLYYVSIPKWFD